MLKVLKKIFLTVTTLILIAQVGCCAEDYVSLTTAEAQREMTTLEKNLQRNMETFKVGYIKNTGFVTEDLPGHMTGYGYEYMEFLSNYAHCNFEYVEAKDWDDLVSKLQSGKVEFQKCSEVTKKLQMLPARITLSDAIQWRLWLKNSSQI